MERKSFRFVMSKPQRGAVLILLGLIIGVQFFRILSFPKSAEPLSWDASLKVQKELDTTRSKNALAFTQNHLVNPNFLTDYKAYTLGIPPEAFDRLKAYRSQNKFVNSADAFQKITQISDSLLAVLHPQFQYYKKESPKKRERTPKKKLDVNSAEAQDFDQVYGIGTVLSQRIIKYRSYLSGFASLDQFYEVYGLDSLVVQRLMDRFEIRTPPRIAKKSLKTVSLEELINIPYLNEEEARKIIGYRSQNEVINMKILSELFVNSPNKHKRLKLYLY